MRTIWNLALWTIPEPHTQYEIVSSSPQPVHQSFLLQALLATGRARPWSTRNKSEGFQVLTETRHDRIAEFMLSVCVACHFFWDFGLLKIAVRIVDHFLSGLAFWRSNHYELRKEKLVAAIRREPRRLDHSHDPSLCSQLRVYSWEHTMEVLKRRDFGNVHGNNWLMGRTLSVSRRLYLNQGTDSRRK